MNNHEINRIIRSDSKARYIFKGCFPRDKLPKGEGLFIANTDPAHLGGSHWVAFHKSGSANIFFDSYGLPPSFYSRDFVKILDKKKKIIINNVRLQSFLTKVCGEYCIYFILMRARGIDTEDIVKNLNVGDFLNNDARVKNIINRLYRRGNKVDKCVGNSQCCTVFKKNDRI